MTFIDAIKSCFNKYATFQGRASRSEYWWFVLFCFLLSLIAGIISHALNAIISILLFLPLLAVLSRRVHDSDKTAWWLLLLFIPFFGAVILLVFAILPPTPGTNRFGEPSK